MKRKENKEENYKVCFRCGGEMKFKEELNDSSYENNRYLDEKWQCKTCGAQHIVSYIPKVVKKIDFV